MKEETKKIIENLKKDLYEGLKMFGEYNFYDKGPDEIFDFQSHKKIIENYFSSDFNEEELLSFIIHLDETDKYCHKVTADLIECLWEEDDQFWDNYYGSFYNKNKSLLEEIQKRL